MMSLSVSPQEATKELAQRELARRHFRHFNRYIYEGYIESWHTRVLCDALESVLAGEIRFLMIEAPPRHSKSIHVSKLFPAFVMGKNRDHDVIVSSYSGDLATDHGRDTRNMVDSTEYQNLFETRLALDSSAKGKWNTNGRGAYNAVGVGGSSTGKGADFFILDDPFKDRKEADSLVIREDRWKWWRSVARTRLSPTGAMVIMHTRWHEDDIIGRLTTGEEKEEWVNYFEWLKGKRAKWVRLTFAAIAEQEERYREKGEALWPQRYPLAELLDIQGTLGQYEWSALYQQKPVDDAAREFKAKYFKKRTMADLEKMVTRKFATIDTALTTTEEADFTGVTRNYVNKQNEFHFRSTRYKINSKAVIDLIFLLHDEGFEKIGIEKGAFTHAVKPFLEDEMKKRGKFPRVVMLEHKQTMKETRIRGLIPWYENGQIFHIEGECNDLEQELLAFPKGTHDDCADSAAYQPEMSEIPFDRKEYTQKPFETAMPYDNETHGPPNADQKPMRKPASWEPKTKFQQGSYESSFPVDGLE